MKKIKLITLLVLSPALGLHAGCWMPESDTVKNYYKGIDGGYIKVKGKDDSNTYYLRLKGTIRRMLPDVRGKGMYIIAPRWMIDEAILKPRREEGSLLYFMPKGFKKGRFYPRDWGWRRRFRIVGFKPDEWLLKIIKEEWPHLTSISTEIVNIYTFPCYINTTKTAFEKFKKDPGKTLKEREEEREKQKRARKRKKMGV